MMWLSNAYQWFWFHTEFWWTPVNRRPYTFVMRDWIYKHMNWFLTMTFTWFAGMVALSVWHGTTATVLSICTGMLVAHLVWGSAWIEDQQEYPEYLGGE